ncbi:MAG: TldD/PmbA family protein [Acidimicrobiia bacterium]|nr:TldD/PmbA family protein [Acidimicrobiia bacterium]
MIDPTTVRDQLLERVGDRAEAQVVVTVGPSELTRFANSFIHQNVGEIKSRVALTVASDGRTAELVGSSTTDEGLARLVEQSLDVVRISPVDPDWPGLAPPAPCSEVPRTEEPSPTPQQRADAVKTFLAAAPDLNGAGYCETETLASAFGNSLGQSADGVASRTVFDGILRTDTSSGSAHHCSSSFGSLDPAGLGRVAAERARQGIHPVTIDTGVYEVVLGHDAMAEVVLELGIFGFGGPRVVDKESFVQSGVQQFDSAITLVDDALAPGGLNYGFDVEGTPKERLVLIDAGVSGVACHSRRTGRRMGQPSNGHAPVGELGEWYGGGPMDLMLAGGTKTVDELISEVERGIYVATFNYCRCLEPLTVEVTGLTRNGTFLIEKGEIVQALTNMRFTQSFVEALAPGNVLGLSNDPRFGNADAGPGYVRAPAARLAGFNFTGNAEG